MNTLVIYPHPESTVFRVCIREGEELRELCVVDDISFEYPIGHQSFTSRPVKPRKDGPDYVSLSMGQLGKKKFRREAEARIVERVYRLLLDSADGGMTSAEIIRSIQTTNGRTNLNDIGTSRLWCILTKSPRFAYMKGKYYLNKGD